MMLTIIDRDIEFYTGMADKEMQHIRCCYPEHEPYYRARLKVVQAIVAALKAYRDAMKSNF